MAVMVRGPLLLCNTVKGEGVKGLIHMKGLSTGSINVETIGPIIFEPTVRANCVASGFRRLQITMFT